MQRFLIDTNVLIPLEPTHQGDVAPDTRSVLEIARIAAESRDVQILIHPGARRDIENDKDVDRRAVRIASLEKYPRLTNPPGIAEVEPVLGHVDPSDNDYVDHLLLAALYKNAVHGLISNDYRLRRKAIRLGLDSERVLTISDALSYFRTLLDFSPSPPPRVEVMELHSLDLSDPVFDSLRLDYEEFDAWFLEKSQEGRQAWVIRTDQGEIAGLCIWKSRDDEYSLGGKVLKVSTFKVSENHGGHRYGELLLKTLFEYLARNRYDHVWLTVFKRHAELVTLLEEFGFDRLDAVTRRGELVMAKGLTAGPQRPSDPFDFHVRFGPPALDFDHGKAYIVPIRPRFHRLLFPDFPGELRLEVASDNRPFGNGLKKAYLCNSPTKSLTRGSILFFYRSGDFSAVTVVGVVEETRRTADAEELSIFAGQRTVYSLAEIRNMARREVLAIRFRQDRLLERALPLRELQHHSVLKRHPQSITRVRNEEALKWLSQQIQSSP